jgi:Chlamydia polymorphic membrane protein (Chlamydia_PMP).
LGNDANFENNIASKVDIGSGGGIYVDAYADGSDSSASIEVGNNANFTGNIAGQSNAGQGGAVYLSASADNAASFATMNLGDNATFTDNIAGQGDDGYGGAIYAVSLNNIGSASVTIGNSATFTGNVANENGTGYGGAIFSGGPNGGVTINGSNNQFRDNKAGTLGGAVYATGNATFIADGGDMIFEGNTAHSIANAIYMSNSGDSKTLILAAKAASNIIFNDPITSNDTNQNLDIAINSENGGTNVTDGTVAFDGAYWRDPAQGKTPNNAPAFFTSTVYGDTTVYGGKMSLYNGVTYGADSSTGSFTLNDAATLAVSNNGYTNTVQAETIALAQDSVLSFDLANAAPDGSLSCLTLRGTNISLKDTVSNALTFAINLDTWQDGTFVLVEANTNDFTGFDLDNALNRMTGVPANVSPTLELWDNDSKLVLTFKARAAIGAATIPTLNTIALLLLALMVIVTGWRCYRHRFF